MGVTLSDSAESSMMESSPSSSSPSMPFRETGAFDRTFGNTERNVNMMFHVKLAVGYPSESTRLWSLFLWLGSRLKRGFWSVLRGLVLDWYGCGWLICGRRGFHGHIWNVCRFVGMGVGDHARKS